jgi:hypothetical protein
MVALIVKHRGRDLPQTEQIKQVLDDAIRPCRERNLLAHGAWWCFNRREMDIMVRGGVRWDDQQSPPGNHLYPVSDIEARTDRFEALLVELYNIRRSLEAEPDRSQI